MEFEGFLLDFDIGFLRVFLKKEDCFTVVLLLREWC
jgi:hypothetical protein